MKSNWILAVIAWTIFVLPVTYCTMKEGENGAAMEKARLEKGVKPIEYRCANLGERDAAQAAVCAAYFSNIEDK